MPRSRTEAEWLAQALVCSAALLLVGLLGGFPAAKYLQRSPAGDVIVVAIAIGLVAVMLVGFVRATRQLRNRSAIVIALLMLTPGWVLLVTAAADPRGHAAARFWMLHPLVGENDLPPTEPGLRLPLKEPGLDMDSPRMTARPVSPSTPDPAIIGHEHRWMQTFGGSNLPPGAYSLGTHSSIAALVREAPIHPSSPLCSVSRCDVDLLASRWSPPVWFMEYSSVFGVGPRGGYGYFGDDAEPVLGASYSQGGTKLCPVFELGGGWWWLEQPGDLGC